MFWLIIKSQTDLNICRNPALQALAGDEVEFEGPTPLEFEGPTPLVG